MSKRLHGHLTNAKDTHCSDKTRVRRKVRTEYLSDVIVGRAVEIRKTSDKQFRLHCSIKLGHKIFITRVGIADN